jgi:hypothetical protein
MLREREAQDDARISEYLRQKEAREAALAAEREEAAREKEMEVRCRPPAAAGAAAAAGRGGWVAGARAWARLWRRAVDSAGAAASIVVSA